MPPSTLRLARRLTSILPPVMLAFGLSACAGSITISRAALPCSKLVPSQLSDDTSGADLPEGSTVGDWIAYANAEAGQLDKANLTKASTLSIIRSCEARDAAIDAQLTKRKKVLGVF